MSDTQMERHLRPRVGNDFKLRSWDRRVIRDEFDPERFWLAYRLADRTSGQTAVQVDRLDPNTDRRVVAFFVKSMRRGLKAIVAEGPPS